MKSLIKLASLLDKNGNYLLADKIDKIAQAASNDVLESNDPVTFVNSLFGFARNKNINNLSQAFNSYSKAGAKYKGTPINTNKETIKLYQYVVQNPRVLYPQQLVGVLQANFDNPSGASNQQINSNVFQNARENLEARATDYDNLNDQAVPTNYSYYYNYLNDRGLNRIAPVGKNNDEQRRETGYLKKQDEYYQEYIKNIGSGQDVNAAMDEINSDANLTKETRQKLYTTMFLPYVPK
jgi:hypothetical protein